MNKNQNEDSLKLKKAVVTLCIGTEEWAPYTHPPMMLYAKKINADFIWINSRRVNYNKVKNVNPVLFEKYQIYDILEDYDRVLYIDSDVLITPHAKNIFDYVPYDKIGGVFEDFGMDMEDRRKRIKKVQEILGDVGWTEGFMNSGVFVVSKPHRDAFKYICKYGALDLKYEQTNTNWYFRKAGYDIINIDYRFNYMGIMRVYYGTEPRDAYFIHYAGGGIYNWIPRLEQVKDDYEYFYKDIDRNDNLEDFEIIEK
ncbi:MAG: glycosyltransferase [Promethearchaeota archaeon]